MRRWNLFRTICSSHRKIGVALELSANLPSEDIIQRWLGEPVRCLIIPTSLFSTNRKGFPVLPKSHQSVVQRFYVVPVEFSARFDWFDVDYLVK